jgi:Right handed beta helix region
MQKYKLFGAAIAVASALFAISAPAHAQATRTWVSGVGSDADPCSRTAPCKTFAGAISKTAINGIINCIDSGAYGNVTIIHSVTIDCHDVFASVLAGQDAVNGIIINVAAGDPKDPWRTVRLRNIDIAGVGIGAAGVSIISAAAVIIEDGAVTGFTKQGIIDTRTEGGTTLAIKNTVVANNAGSGVSAGGQNNNVVLDNVHSIKNSYGVSISKTNTVAINRSVLSNNVTAGVEADSGASMLMDGSVASYNGVGISASGGAVAFGNSDVTFNSTAISGATTSFGNNRIFANTAAGTPPTPAGAAAPALGQQ